MSRKAWAWHPDLKPTEQWIRDDVWMYVALRRTIEDATACPSRPGRPGRGRIRRLDFAVDRARWYVLFVERMDGHGLGGLVLDKRRASVTIPDGMYDLAAHRLSQMPDW
jgi:hypothetical protein